MNYLTLAATLRNAERYVQEWLCFHKVVGVEKFVVMLHKCDDGTEDRIKELSFSSDIHVHHITDKRNIATQMGTYQWIVRNYWRTTEWMLFIDYDEYFYPTIEDDLKPILQQYEDFSGVAAFWHHFGHNNHFRRPEGLRMEIYTARRKSEYEVNRGVKSAVRPREILAMMSPHLQMTIRETVTEKREPILGTYFDVKSGKPSWDVLRCDHHYTGCARDYLEKAERGSCNYFFGTDDGFDVRRFVEKGMPDVHDGTKLRFLDQVKGLMNG